MKLSELLAKKGDAALTINPQASVAEATRIMHDNHVGSVIVPSETGAPQGIITERDVMRLCACGKAAELESITVQECMTKNVVCGSPDDSIDDALSLMTQRRFRRLPIVAGHELMGLLSIGDLVKAKLEQTAQEAQALRDYIVS